MAKKTKAKGEVTASFVENDELLLGVLTVVEQNVHLSQRHVSSELGVALGLANAYLRRCVHKGLIKIQQVPRRRYIYYLTPHGFAEKARLTGQYLSASFNFFRRSREQMSAVMLDCGNRNMRRIALAGISELAEIATLCAQEHGIDLVGVIDPSYDGTNFFGLPVHAKLSDIENVDVVIVTDLTASGETYNRFVSELGADRVMALRLLRLGEKSRHQFPKEAAE